MILCETANPTAVIFNVFIPHLIIFIKVNSKNHCNGVKTTSSLNLLFCFIRVVKKTKQN